MVNLLGVSSRSMGRAVLRPEMWYLIGMVFAALFFWGGLERSHHPTLQSWANLDSLFPIGIATDTLLDGGSLSGWKFPIAPFVFPDIAICWGIASFERHPIAMMYYYSLIQLTLLAGAWLFCARMAGLSGSRFQFAGMAIVVIALLIVQGISLGDGYPQSWREALHWNRFDRGKVIQLGVPGYHMGCFMASIWCAGLGLWILGRGITDRKGIAIAAILTLMVGLGAGSDLMFVPQFVIAFPMAAGLASLFGLVPFRRVCAVQLLAGLGCALGIWAGSNLINNTGKLDHQSDCSLESIAIAWDTFLAGVQDHLFDHYEFWHWAATIWLMGCLLLAMAVFVHSARDIFSKHSRSPDTNRLRPLPQRSIVLVTIFGLFLAFSSLGSMATLILGGTQFLLNDQYWVTLKFHGVWLYSPVFGLPIVLGWLFQKLFDPPRWAGTLLLGVGAMVSIGVPAWLLKVAPENGRSVYRYQPPVVREIDQIAERHALTAGIAEYGAAMQTKLYSRHHFRMAPVNHVLHPFHWCSNEDWFYGKQGSKESETGFNFVLVDRDDDPNIGAGSGYFPGVHPPALVERFGEPAVRVLLEHRWELWIYNRATDRDFRSALRPTLPPRH